MSAGFPVSSRVRSVSFTVIDSYIQNDRPLGNSFAQSASGGIARIMIPLAGIPHPATADAQILLVADLPDQLWCSPARRRLCDRIPKGPIVLNVAVAECHGNY